MANLKVSVGLVTYNSAENLTPLLMQLLNQTLAFEQLIIIDNGSTDETHHILQKFSRENSKIYYFKNDSNNIALARQKILMACNSDLIAFVDSDCSIEANWLEEHLKNISKEQDNKVIGWGGPNRPLSTGHVNQSLSLMLSSFWGNGGSPQGVSPDNAWYVDHLPTTNAIFKCDELNSMKGFDSRQGNVCEDVELGHRIHENSFKLKQYPLPLVYNGNYKSWNQWALRMFRFGKERTKLGLQWKTFPPSVLFSLTFVFLIFLSLLPFSAFSVFRTILGVYFIFSILVSFWISISNRQPFSRGIHVFVSFFVTHLYYGLGSWIALLNWKNYFGKSRRLA